MRKGRFEIIMRFADRIIVPSTGKLLVEVLPSGDSSKL
jgi:hypothetical protein